MKKVMIGILILIPIIVLFIVAMVSSIVTRDAWIAVEDIEVYYKNTQTVADNLSLNLTSVEKSFMDYFDVKVLPEKANRYTLNWEIVGNIVYTDEDYEKEYEAYREQERIFDKDFDESYVGFETEDGVKQGKYVEKIAEVFNNNQEQAPYYYNTQQEKDALKERIRIGVKQLVLVVVNPAVMLVDGQGNEVGSNEKGEFLVSSYCSFSLKVSAENHSRTINVEVVGDQVEKVVLSNLEGEDNQLVIGQSRRIIPVYTPIHSIVGNTVWRSDNESVATVDQNGVITAKGVGSANIYVKASKHGSDDGESVQYVESGAYTVEVTANDCGSVKFGNRVLTSKKVVTFEELGIAEASATEGCSVEGNKITLTADVARVETENGELTIVKCEEGEIAISNAEFFEYGKGGFVLAVSDLTLKLEAVFKDMLSTNTLSDVEWTSSNESVATVDQNGEVRALSNGLVTITATANGKTSTVTLNVQHKLASMDLKTSNDALAIGIAQETVFASEKYTDSMTKVANSVRIVVQGEPMDADETQLKAFYSAYTFEIVSGGEYAEFDANEKNRLVFKNTLEGKGKQNITVKVSALYPKYEGFTKFTTKEVTIKAVYGVEVNNIAELRKAAEDQNEYVHRDGIFIERHVTFEHIREDKGETYQTWAYDSSLINYAIVLMSNITYEYRDKVTGEIVEFDKDRVEKGEIEAVSFDKSVSLYGDVYGNNHMISTTKEHLTGHDKPLGLAWGNTTLSNLIVRANDLGEDAIITDAKDTKGFAGECVRILAGDVWDDEEYHLENINIEYCIFENALKFTSAYNIDINMKGCVLRNMSQCSIYSPARMQFERDIYYTMYMHLTTENVVVSNCLGTFGSFAYDGMVKFKSDSNGGKNRFFDDNEQNLAYFNEHFASKGVNHVINQKGFLDVYNWQDVNNATLIDTGNEEQNNLISSFAGPLISENSMFKPFVYVDEKGTTYFHMGFILTGLGGVGLIAEPNLTEINLEDKRFERIYARDIKAEGDSAFAAGILRKLEINFYCYKPDNVDENGKQILPNSSYTMDSALIKRLHG